MGATSKQINQWFLDNQSGVAETPLRSLKKDLMGEFHLSSHQVDLLMMARWAFRNGEFNQGDFLDEVDNILRQKTAAERVAARHLQQK